MGHVYLDISLARCAIATNGPSLTFAEQLEAEGIVKPAPRPPSPPRVAPAAGSAPRPTPPAGDRREEKEALRKRLRELEDDDDIAVVPKREVKPKIKPEPVAGPSRPAKRQVIDLTLDD